MSETSGWNTAMHSLLLLCDGLLDMLQKHALDVENDCIIGS